MTMILGLCLTLAAWDGPVSLDTKVTLATPEDSDYFFDVPLAFDVDESGFYLADGGAKVIFHWSIDGEFQGTIGQPGSGPGEFVFAGRGRPTAHVVLHDKKLYVHDGGKRKVLVFSRDGAFEKDVNFGISRSRVSQFAVTPNGQFLVQRSRFSEETRTNEIVLLDAEGKVVTTFNSEPLSGFRMRGNRGNRNFTITAFNASMTSHYNHENGELIFGNGGESSFKIQGLDGKAKSIKLPIPQRELTQADRDEHQETLDDRRRGRVTYEYPDNKPFFDQILPVGNRGYLAFAVSPFHRDIDGVFVDKDGNLKGRVKHRCGENGGLIGARGRLLMISLDEDDEFQIQEVAP